jgi:hypothetical protein
MKAQNLKSPNHHPSQLLANQEEKVVPYYSPTTKVSTMNATQQK